MSRYTFGFVVGSAAFVAGCAMGLMLAPASGTEVRRRLAWRLDEERQTLARNLDRLKEQVERRCTDRGSAKPTAA